MANKKVKIVATVGPASKDSRLLAHMADEGVDVFRVNLSHLTTPQAMEYLKVLQTAQQRTKKQFAILGDLAGPKVRVGEVAPATVFQAGDVVDIVAKPIVGSRRAVSVNFPQMLRHIQKGARIYLSEGLIQLEALRVSPERIQARVLIGGPLLSRKAFSAEGVSLLKFSLQSKDKEQIVAMAKAGVQALAVSFVQSAADIQAVRRLVPSGLRPLLVAKLETAPAVHHAAQIVDAADAVMIARGDLGFAVPMPQLPLIQKDIINLCLARAKPVITATQMLESMVESPLPTRAEISDVANAILDGTDAVMLSAETAMGKFPLQVVRTMASVISTVQSSVPVKPEFHDAGDLVTDAVSAAVVRAAADVNARLIVVFTKTGATARRLARHRPLQPILALSPDRECLRQLNLSWGVEGIVMKDIRSLDDLIRKARQGVAAYATIRLKKGETFVVSAGVPFGQSGTTNMLLVQKA